MHKHMKLLKIEIIRKIYSIYKNLKYRIILIKIRKNIHIRKNVRFGKGALINPDSIIYSKTIIGDHTIINGKIIIKGVEKVIFGKYCAVGDAVRIITSNHLITHPNMQMTLQKEYGFHPIVDLRGPVQIGNNVWIGDMVTILPGVKVGSASVIGACSVVTKDVEPFSVVVGVPAKTIRKRFTNEIIDELMIIKWWDWPEERIRKNKFFFETDLTKISIDELKSIIVL